MNGKGRALDNARTERFFRSLKYDDIYINEYVTPREMIKGAVFVKLVVAIPNKFHCSYDALLSLGFDSSFERSGLSQTLSGNSQSLVEPVQRSGCLAFANS